MADSTVRCSVDEMADQIANALAEYADLASADSIAAAKKAAKLVKSEIQANSPVQTGKYKKSWKIKTVSENDHAIEQVVYSSNRYQIAHLLEKGHAKRNGGRVAAIPHIAPAEQAGEELLLQEIEDALKQS